MSFATDTQAYIDGLLTQRQNLFTTEAKPLIDIAATRAFTSAEAKRSADVDAAFVRFDHAIATGRAQLERSGERDRLGLSTPDTTQSVTRGTLVNLDTRQPAAVQRDHAFTSHPVAEHEASTYSQRDAATVAQYGDMGGLLRAISTTSGSALVPTVWNGQLIDLARNASCVIQAGAQTIPMGAKTVQIGRLTGDPTAAFRAEGSAITASDPTFDNVTLTARTLNALVVADMEWLQDADGAESIVMQAIGKAIGLKIDLVALYGGITAGAGTIDLPIPENPRGVLATLNALAAGNVLGAADNGTTQTAGHVWDEVLDTAFTPQDANEVPNAMIWSSKAARLYAKAVDTLGQPLTMPPAIAALERYTSNQIPSYAKGTLATATDLFVGDFAQVLIGQRLGLTVQVLTERYADSGQLGIIATWRGDIGIARPKGLAVYKAIKGA
jgi:HK97 family phage major capsid protein